GMSKWYTYLDLKAVKEGSGGLQHFYAVVDEILNRNEGCALIRLWDRSKTTVVIKLLGSFVIMIDKGDVMRVHRFERRDQGDSYGTIGYGEPGKVTQVVLWR
ncbi:hypothetical protein PENTCL1PPCAC_26286, partial [Pristionchus entomophagus]